MKVFLIRHGDADAEIPEGLDDKARALTARARQTLPGHFTALAAHLGKPELILCSPLVRAVQTATVLAHVLGYDGVLRTHRNLFPDGPTGALEALLAEERASSVVLVGHQPAMGSAAAHFLGIGTFPKPFSPGTVVGIERPDTNPSAGKLLFYAPPGQPPSDTL